MLWEVAENENDRFLWFVHNMQFSLIEFFEFTNFCSFWTSLVSTFSSSYHKKWPDSDEAYVHVAQTKKLFRK